MLHCRSPIEGGRWHLLFARTLTENPDYDSAQEGSHPRRSGVRSADARSKLEPVLATGATDGLGRAADILFAEHGYPVFAGGRHAERPRDEVTREARAALQMRRLRPDRLLERRVGKKMALEKLRTEISLGRGA